jgi:hypothetical protein
MATKRKPRKRPVVAAVMPPGLEWVSRRKPPRRANGKPVESLRAPAGKSRRGETRHGRG